MRYLLLILLIGCDPCSLPSEKITANNTCYEGRQIADCGEYNLYDGCEQ